ncbi:MAG TPA: IRE (iron responsive element), partial [Lacipirellulaceae bacterium]|nr:IRE (iron responsive element) [Lacipirellulaceae bacterium]
MNPSVYRKVAYLAALVALLFPMAWLGAPATRGGPGQPDDPGGKLAQLRSEAKLGQADLGAIDPASETIRMATLGLRGLAVTMLWNKANEFKKTEDWTAFQATLEQLAKLQPYFVKVWQYQAWNLSHNVSVELDDVRDRFYYVKQGIQYLQQGIQYLRDNPTLLDDLGWFCGNKVGRADEKMLYRRMFKLDEELHAPDVEPVRRDNWL